MFDLGSEKRNSSYNYIMNCLHNEYISNLNQMNKLSFLQRMKIIFRTGNIVEKYKFYAIRKRQKRYKEKFYPNEKWSIQPNFIVDKKIAIYTVIFGDYDDVAEPEFIPDNCDFYIITDKNIDPKSAWKKLDLDLWKDEISSLNNAQKNRYFKMLPHKVFKDYEYSLYLDGNVRVRLDVSALLDRIGKYGIAVQRHHARYCVYDEANYFQLLKHQKIEKINEYITYLKDRDMPRGYGMLQCNVILREHNNPDCIKIMEMWWAEFSRGGIRDQLSLPYVLYLNNISIEEVDGLGNNWLINPFFELVKHKNNKK